MQHIIIRNRWTNAALYELDVTDAADAAAQKRIVERSIAVFEQAIQIQA